jgi:fructose-1,6-bisphosphatase/inositol monophosphatase family enzyme
VTDVDLTIQNEIRDFLQRMTPDKDFLGEEDLTTTTGALARQRPLAQFYR